MRRSELLVRIFEKIGVAPLLRPWIGGIGTIFVLHRVAPAGGEVIDPDLMVQADFLDSVLTAVRRAGCEIVTLDEISARLRDEHWKGRRLVSFTFDDGYRDNATEALPVFQAHKAPLAIYLTTGLLDRSIDYWWGALERLVRSRDHLEARQLGLEADLVSTTTEEKRRALATLQAWTHKDLEKRAPQITAWCSSCGISSAEELDKNFMSWDEVRTLARDPLVTIGAHTVTHPRLSRLPEGEARAELLDARIRIEQEIGRPVRHLAYPYGGPGACGNREAELARDTGYETAVTTRRGNVFKVHGGHLTALPRQGVVEGIPDLNHIPRCLNGLAWFLRRGPRIAKM